MGIEAALNPLFSPQFGKNDLEIVVKVSVGRLYYGLVMSNWACVVVVALAFSYIYAQIAFYLGPAPVFAKFHWVLCRETRVQTCN